MEEKFVIINGLKYKEVLDNGNVYYFLDENEPTYKQIFDNIILRGLVCN